VAALSSFDELLRLLDSLEGTFMEARDSSGALSIAGSLVHQQDNPKEQGESAGIVGEWAEMFCVGEGGRVSLFRSNFRSAVWDESMHQLTINTTTGTIVLTDEWWGK